MIEEVESIFTATSILPEKEYPTNLEKRSIRFSAPNSKEKLSEIVLSARACTSIDFVATVTYNFVKIFT